MLRRSSTWLYLAGAWLVLSGVAHLGANAWLFVMERGLFGLRGFAAGAMKQAILVEDPLQPSLWGLFLSFGTTLGLLILFAGGVGVIIARAEPPLRLLRAYALYATVFWTVVFVATALIAPVSGTMATALVAVPLHGLAHLTATEAAPAL